MYKVKVASKLLFLHQYLSLLQQPLTPAVISGLLLHRDALQDFLHDAIVCKLLVAIGIYQRLEDATERIDGPARIERVDQVLLVEKVFEDLAHKVVGVLINLFLLVL